jgi:hypothetical protein
MDVVEGTWEDAEALVGSVIAIQVGADPVNEPMVRQYLESLEWDSPAWNLAPSGAEAPASTPRAPFAMYMTFGMPAYWSPGDPHLPDQSLAPFPFGRVPAPGTDMLATGTDVEFRDPMLVGDLLTVTWRLVGVARKKLKIGNGGFLDFEATYRNQRNGVVAVQRTSVFRYTPEALDA